MENCEHNITRLNWMQVLSTFFAALLLASCGGGGGGGGSSGGTTPPLATGIFAKTVDNTATPVVWTSLLGATAGSRYMMLYPASEIKGSGNINAISLRYGATETDAITCPNVTIKMGHTNVATLNGTFGNNIEQGQGSFETILSNASVTIPTGLADSILTIDLDTPFAYNGVDNLVVEITRGAACSTSLGLTSFDVAAGTVSYNGLVFNNTNATAPTGLSRAESMYAKLHFAGGDNEQNMGGLGNNMAFSFSSYRQQSLYLASEINGSGPITGMAFQMGHLSVAGKYRLSIKMGHSTLSTLGATYAANYSDTPVTVANAVTVNIPANIPAGGWFWVPLPDGVFEYNGTDNLIVNIDKTSGTANNGVRFSVVAGRRAEGQSGALVANAVDTVYYHHKFRFNGGTMDNIVSNGFIGDNSRWFTASGTGATDQNLYMDSELGTSGAITKIACRMNAPVSSTVPYPNFDVVMSHTSATALVTDLVANMPTPVVVRSGPFTTPAGLVTGDWIEVPLTTTFNYDSTQNLVVQVQSDAGASAHSCSVLDDVVRYADNRRASNADRASATGTIVPQLKDMRVWITK